MSKQYYQHIEPKFGSKSVVSPASAPRAKDDNDLSKSNGEVKQVAEDEDTFYEMDDMFEESVDISEFDTLEEAKTPKVFYLFARADREKEELLCRTSSLRFQQFSFSHFCFQFSISFHFLVAKILGSAHKCQLTVGNKHDNGFPVQSFPSYIFVFIIFI